MKILNGVRDGLQFDRGRYVYAACMFGFAGVGAQFGIVVLSGQNPVTPELYGPSVYAVPALFWAGAQVACCGVAGFGCLIGGRRGAGLALLGASPALMLFVLLWVLALDAAQGTLVVAGNRSITAPLTGTLVAAAFRRAFL